MLSFNSPVRAHFACQLACVCLDTHSMDECTAHVNQRDPNLHTSNECKAMSDKQIKQKMIAMVSKLKP